MSEYDNTNRGAIWPNDRMRDGKKDPEFTGSLNVDGVDYWVSAWKRKADAKQGAPSLSFSVNRKDANTTSRKEYASKAEQRRHESQQPDFDDDIPF